MVQAQEVVSERRVRRWRSVAEKRQIVQLTLEGGASVAEVARAHGVNANQVFKWRRAFERGELIESWYSSAAGYGDNAKRGGERCRAGTTTVRARAKRPTGRRLSPARKLGRRTKCAHDGHSQRGLRCPLLVLVVAH